LVCSSRRITPLRLHTNQCQWHNAQNSSREGLRWYCHVTLLPLMTVTGLVELLHLTRCSVQLTGSGGLLKHSRNLFMGVLFNDWDYTASAIYGRVWNLGGMTLPGENRNTSEKPDIRHKSQRLAWDRTRVSTVRGRRLTVGATAWLRVLYDTWYIYWNWVSTWWQWSVNVYKKMGEWQIYTEGETIHKTIQNAEYTKQKNTRNKNTNIKEY